MEHVQSPGWGRGSCKTGTTGEHQSHFQNGILERDFLPTRPLALLAVRNAGYFHLGSTPKAAFLDKAGAQEMFSGRENE